MLLLYIQRQMSDPPDTPSREAVLTALRSRMLAFARSRVRPEVAEDLVQDALLLIATKYASAQTLDELVPLAVQILHFKMSALWRKERRRGESTAIAIEDAGLHDPAPDPEALAVSAQLLEHLAAAFRRLRGRCRDVFQLKLEGRSFREIAEFLGADSVNTVYSWDLRCRKKLRRDLGPFWELYR